MDKLQSPSMFIGVRGKGIISFGSGQPDLPPPESIFKILPGYRSFKYGLIQGNLNLRKALSKEYQGSDEDNFVVDLSSKEQHKENKVRSISFDDRGGCSGVLLFTAVVVVVVGDSQPDELKFSI